MHDERVEVVGQAAGGGGEPMLVELVNQGLESLLGVGGADRFIERVPIGVLDTLALAVGDPDPPAVVSFYTVATTGITPGGAIAFCRPGDVATGGGLDETAVRGPLALSVPDGTTKPDGWFVLGATGNDTMEAVAVCADTS